MGQLDGKVAVITGGTAGMIGSGTVCPARLSPIATIVPVGRRLRAPVSGSPGADSTAAFIGPLLPSAGRDFESFDCAALRPDSPTISALGRPSRWSRTSAAASPGITDEETVLALADSFRLDNCVTRDRLAGILSAAARQPG